MSNKTDKEEAFKTVFAVIGWMDRKRKGQDFPPKMKEKLVKTTEVLRGDIEDPSSQIYWNRDDILYE